MKYLPLIVVAAALFGAGCQANMNASVRQTPEPAAIAPGEPLPKDANGNPKTGDAQLDAYINDGSMADPDSSVQMDDTSNSNPPAVSGDADDSIYLNL